MPPADAEVRWRVPMSGRDSSERHRAATPLELAIGLDLERFDDELARHVHAGRIREDFMSGVRSGVNGTPTSFINGVRHDGPFDAATLLGALERASTAIG